MTDEERRGIERYLQRRVDESSDDWRDVREEANRQSVIPDVKSYWSSMSIDDFGYIWIAGHTDYTMDDPYMESTQYMLLSPEGEYLGDVQYPLSRAWVSNSFILATREDEDTGETEFIVYRMIPVPEGFTYP